MNQLPTISVIVPLYNAANYLERCIGSIQKQSFTHYELILVNDGSTDNSLAICKEYAGKDSRVKVINKQNGGVSSARNAGLVIAKGEWIYFCDADDELAHNTVFETFTRHIQPEIDLLAFGLKKITHDGKILEQPRRLVEKLYTREEYAYQLFKLPYGFYQGYTHTKLFRHSIIKEHNLRFKEYIYYNEDRLFIMEYLDKCKGKVDFFTDILYIYHENTTGAMASKLKAATFHRYETDLDAFIEMYHLPIIQNTKKAKNNCKKSILVSVRNNKALIKNFSSDKTTDLQRIKDKTMNIITPYDQISGLPSRILNKALYILNLKSLANLNV